MDNGFLLILVGFIGVVVGFALGMGVASLRAVPPAEKSAGQPAFQPIAQPMSPSAPEAPPANPSAGLTDPPEVVPVSASLTAPIATEKGLTLATVVESAAGREAPRGPILNPLNVISRALKAEVRAPDSANKSIAVQVDEILQEMLKNSPLAARAIKLMELPAKGMVVMVGLDQYDGVEAVPDDEIRSLIRAAVAEWERRATHPAA